MRATADSIRVLRRAIWPCRLFAPPEVNGAVPAFITQACAYLLEGVNLSDASALITPNPWG